MGKSRECKHPIKNYEDLKPATIRIYVNGKFKGFWINPKHEKIGFMILTRNFKIGGFDENDNPIHLECTCCDNEWKRRYGKLNEKFEVKDYGDSWIIHCKLCGVEEIVKKVELKEFD